MFKKIQKLRSPKELKQIYPVNKQAKLKTDQSIRDILLGLDNRYLAVVGPCSLDCEKHILEYVKKLKTLQEKVISKLLIIPRLYVSKPRSQMGFRGIIHSPDLANENIVKGIEYSRKILSKISLEFGISGANELLYPNLYSYYDDLLSYVAIGARSCENQMHRMFASGLDVAVGIKNSLNGNIATMVNSVTVVRNANRFALNDYEVVTTGNNLAHSIFRGYVSADGKSHYNADKKSVSDYIQQFLRQNSTPAPFLVDLSHDNSKKCYSLQPKVLQDVIKNCKDADYKKYFKGFMCESYLLSGKNKTVKLNGRSNTDGCLGFEETEQMILDFYNYVN